jgi:hypothetical protein
MSRLDGCDFRKTTPRGQWYFGRGESRAMRAPRYGAGQQGIPKGPPRAIKRCPKCGKRLRLRASYCIGGEWVGWFIPDHKPRVMRAKSPKRKNSYQSRGK